MGNYLPAGGYGMLPADGAWGQDPATFTAGGTIAGGQLVELSADNTVIACGGANRPAGVASNDATAGQPVTLWPLSQVIHETTVTGTVTIAAGAPVKAAAAGAVDTGTLAGLGGAGTLLGVCVKGATGPAKCRWIGV